jgi:phage host-nuclease inhibitor protein Gam
MANMDDIEMQEIEMIEEERNHNKDIKERYKITDLKGLGWAFRKIKVLNEKKAEITDYAEAELKRIRDWHDQETKSLDDSIVFFEGLLAEYYSGEKQKDAKVKKISCPWGYMSTRKQQPVIDIRKDEVVKWLKENDYSEFIKVSEEIDKAEIKKRFITNKGKLIAPDGQVVEGVMVEERPEKFVVKVEEK